MAGALQPEQVYDASSSDYLISCRFQVPVSATKPGSLGVHCRNIADLAGLNCNPGRLGLGPNSLILLYYSRFSEPVAWLRRGSLTNPGP